MTSPEFERDPSSQPRWWILPALLTLAVVGCVAFSGWYWWHSQGLPAELRGRLISQGQLTLVSLNPDHQSTAIDKLHNWEVLGRVELTDPDERHEIVMALSRGIAESDGTVAGCFQPRHVLQWTDGTERLDIVICFECLSMSTYTNGTQGPGYITTRFPQTTFNQTLKRHSLPLAP